MGDPSMFPRWKGPAGGMGAAETHKDHHETQSVASDMACDHHMTRACDHHLTWACDHRVTWACDHHVTWACDHHVTRHVTIM